MIVRIRKGKDQHWIHGSGCLKSLLGVLVTAGLIATPQVVASDDAILSMNAARQADLVGEIGNLIGEKYVDPEVGAKAIEQLKINLAAGYYESLSSPRDLAGALTEDLSEFDEHFHVFWNPPGSGPTPGSHTEESEAEWAEISRIQNYGFEKVARLPGNLGYLDLRYFDSVTYAGSTAVAAMAFVTNTDAVIVDLRQNGGGEPAMVQLLLSYFFGPERVHYNSFYSRAAGPMEQYWSLARIEGARMPEVPLYILTSRRTGSAAEGFAYALQALGRATIIGWVTAGAANPGETFEAIDGFSVFVSTGKAVNPITGTNWEKKGVQPDIDVSSVDALETARILALERLQDSGGDSMARLDSEWALEALRAKRNPIAQAIEQLTDYVGTYGNRKLARGGDRLTYQRGARTTYLMTPLGDDRFLLEGKDGFRTQFERGADGNIVRMVDMWSDGHVEANVRNEGTGGS